MLALLCVAWWARGPAATRAAACLSPSQARRDPGQPGHATGVVDMTPASWVHLKAFAKSTPPQRPQRRWRSWQAFRNPQTSQRKLAERAGRWLTQHAGGPGAGKASCKACRRGRTDPSQPKPSTSSQTLPWLADRHPGTKASGGLESALQGALASRSGVEATEPMSQLGSVGIPAVLHPAQYDSLPSEGQGVELWISPGPQRTLSRRLGLKGARRIARRHHPAGRCEWTAEVRAASPDWTGGDAMPVWPLGCRHAATSPGRWHWGWPLERRRPRLLGS